MPILEVSEITKKFGGMVALDGLSFSVNEGEIFGIIGPNGAGKTTLFNILTGFLGTSGGSIRLQGNEISQLKPFQIVALGAARSFQIVKPFFEMTVRETLAVSGQSPKIRKRYPDPAVLRQRDDALLERLGLLDKADSEVDELNQGELRLLDIGRAMATEPMVLFLDEPFSGLGADHVEKLSSLLLGLRGEGVTIVIIEHRLKELMRLVDRVMAINFGRKLAENTPTAIVEDKDVIEAYLGSNWGNDDVAQH